MNEQELYKRCHELFEYRDGQLFWKFSRVGVSKGKRAGSFQKALGYRRVMIDRVGHMEHRIIFLMNYGYLPEMIDHINGTRDDNRLENIRAATCQQNQYNRKVAFTNKLQIKGVFFDVERNKYRAVIRINGKSKILGRFPTVEAAKLAYNEAAEKHHKEFARF